MRPSAAAMEREARAKMEKEVRLTESKAHWPERVSVCFAALKDQTKN